jgi:AcrR family transcriptional regulator
MPAVKGDEVTSHPDGSRQRLLDAAAELISADPDQNVSVREICTRAGVQLPTLYHFFESKRGLIDAVTEAGFARLTEQIATATADGSADPFRQLVTTWDEHVAFGTAHPSFYVLMYGRVAPARRSPGADLAWQQLLGFTSQAAAQGLLNVTAEEAAERILATLTGMVLHLIAAAVPDPVLSATTRDATYAGIRRGGTSAPADAGSQIATHAAALMAALELEPTAMPTEESQLLLKWLRELSTRTS